MSVQKLYILTVLLNILFFSMCYANDSSVLNTNPFIKPNSLLVNTNSNNSNADKQYSQTEIQLHATLYSEDQSLANVNGKIIFVGEEINGYKLISVGEGVAIFKKNGEEITLSVSEIHEKLQSR